jgi:ribosome-binding protein aMBF1 (putative translation factor)
MQGAEKMRHIEEVNITVGSGKSARRFAIPASRKREVMTFISRMKKKVAPERTFSAEEVLPELVDDTQRPATMLRGARQKADMTQAELAKKLGDVRQHHLSEMENGKRPIGKEMAKRLATTLNCDYRVFL